MGHFSARMTRVSREVSHYIMTGAEVVRVGENLRIHWAIEKHSFGGRRKFAIRGSGCAKNDIVSFLLRRLFLYRVY